MNILRFEKGTVTPDEFKFLWDEARKIDREEWTGDKNMAWIELGLLRTPGRWHHKVYHNGVLACVYGLTADSRFWLLGTKALNENPLLLLKWARAQVRWWRYLGIYPQASLLRTNTKHMKWLARLGFELIYDKPYDPYVTVQLMKETT